MMSLIFLIQALAMIAVFGKKTSIGYLLFVVSLILAVFWFAHHATDPLTILL
ncbi:DUF5993 family protein [Dongshaea marina]|uniref:DUF5993 family protein n=1 Tax=Dongshaea marina TaxID=2047966 RepID=UPI0019006725|nr:DUF5993 family protein [Dongshaea marina]